MKHPLPARFDLSEAQRETLEGYGSMLEEIAIPRGLISEGDRARVFERHVVDSLRAAALFGDQDRLCVDMGSGAGLPGIVLAVALPRCEFLLVESRTKRAAFLELAVQRLGLTNAEVSPDRVEHLTVTADAVTARAFAPLYRAWEVAHRILRPGGRLIYFAGERVADPAGVARSLADPSPPVEVAVERVLEKATPLVIMTRG